MSRRRDKPLPAFDLDKPPVYIRARQFAELLDLSPSGFYRRSRAGDFNWALLVPSAGQARYSGTLIARWLRGEAVTGAKPVTPSQRPAHSRA